MRAPEPAMMAAKIMMLRMTLHPIRYTGSRQAITPRPPPNRD
jgi:hypothetical protein